MSDRLRYEVIVEGNDAEGYSAFLPSLLGCVTAAQTIEEIKVLIVEAVTMHIEGMVEDGLPIPEPLTAQQAEEALGIPIPDSVAPGLIVELSRGNTLVPVTKIYTNPETAFVSWLVSEGASLFSATRQERSYPMSDGLTSKELEKKFKEVWPDPNRAWYHNGEEPALRISRAISWVERAEKETCDLDAKFIFYWIAFNSAYGKRIIQGNKQSESDCFSGYIREILELDHHGRIRDVIWNVCSDSIKKLLENRFIFQGWWDFHNRPYSGKDWEISSEKKEFDEENKKIMQALNNHQSASMILDTLFRRLYTMRNQLVHGGSSWDSDMSRTQAQDGVNIVTSVVPIFIYIMMETPTKYWGALHYPRIIYKDRIYPKS